MNDYNAARKAKMQEKYNHILEVAFKLFAEKGIELVTMTEIAEASDVILLPR